MVTPRRLRRPEPRRFDDCGAWIDRRIDSMYMNQMRRQRSQHVVTTAPRWGFRAVERDVNLWM